MPRRLITNTLVNGVTTLLIVAVNLALTPFVIRTLGKDAYGAWVLVLSFSIFSGYFSLFDLGIQAAVVKFVAEHHARKEFRALNEIVSAALVAYAGLGVLSAALLTTFAHSFLTLAFNIPPEQVEATRILLYLLAIQTLFEFPSLAITGILEGLQRYDVIRLVDTVRLAFYVLGVVGLLSAGYGVVSLGAVVFVLALLRTGVFTIIAGRLLPEWRFIWPVPRKVVRRIAGFSGRLLIIRINGVIYYQMDKAIIAAMLASTLLTDYDIASKIHALALTSLTLTSSLIVPAVSALHAVQDTGRLKSLLIRGSKYTAAFCVPTVLTAMLLAEPLIRFWIGPDYAENAGITRLYLAYLLFWALTPVGYNIMIGMGQTAPLVRIQIASIVVNLVLSIVLTPRLGLAGVIWGTLVGNGVAFFPYMRLFLSKVNLSWWEFLGPTVLRTYPQALLSAVALAAWMWLRPPQSLVEVGVYGAASATLYGVVFALSGLDSYEKRLITTGIRAGKLKGYLWRRCQL